MRRVRQAILTFAATIILAWLFARVVSDRYLWSQWLLWIPTPIALFATAIGLTVAMLGRRRDRTSWSLRIAWAAMLFAIALHFSFIEHRLFARSDSSPRGVRVVHWTMPHRSMQGNPLYARKLIELDGDITIVSQVGRFLAGDDVTAALAGGENSHRLGENFTVLSRFPLLERRVLFQNDEIVGYIVRLDTTAALGREMIIYVLDLPSSPMRSRMAIARQARRMIDRLTAVEAPRPDLVVGDFNMTRGSAALRHIFPGLRHAYDDAGAGYGASYHRRLPLYHIDHILLGATLRATSYALVDPEHGRHLAQVAYIRASE